jgi:hypothetical protein
MSQLVKFMEEHVLNNMAITLLWLQILSLFFIFFTRANFKFTKSQLSYSYTFNFITKLAKKSS